MATSAEKKPRTLSRGVRLSLFIVVVAIPGVYSVVHWRAPQMLAQLAFKKLEMATTELPNLDVGEIRRDMDAISFQRIVRAEVAPCPGGASRSGSCEVEPVVAQPSDGLLDLRVERADPDPFLVDLRPVYAGEDAAACETVLHVGAPAPGQLLFAILKTGCPLQSLVRLDQQRLVKLFLLAKNGIHLSAGSADGLDLDRSKPRSISRVTATLGQGTEIGLSLAAASERVRHLWRDAHARTLLGRVNTPGTIYGGLHTQCVVGADQEVSLSGEPLVLPAVDYAKGSIAVRVQSIQDASVDGVPCRVSLQDRPIWSWFIFWVVGVATVLVAPLKLIEALRRLLGFPIRLSSGLGRGGSETPSDQGQSPKDEDRA
jgi:hypothetical protein